MNAVLVVGVSSGDYQVTLFFYFMFTMYAQVCAEKTSTNLTAHELTWLMDVARLQRVCSTTLAFRFVSIFIKTSVHAACYCRLLILPTPTCC